MELIRKLGTRINKNGYLQSYAIFWCDFCKQEVEKRLGDGEKCKSCGCAKNELVSKGNKGKKQTKEAKEKIGNKNKGRLRTEEAKSKQSRTRVKNEVAKGENNPMYGIHRFGEEAPMYSKKHTEEFKNRQSELANKRIGSLAPNWQNGISFELYGIEFNKKFRQLIYSRDNYTCQCPDCEHKTNLLDVHHIDYDKKNNSLENLTTLCRSCHAKTFGKKNRDHWVEFYQNIMMYKLLECLL